MALNVQGKTSILSFLIGSGLLVICLLSVIFPILFSIILRCQTLSFGIYIVLSHLLCCTIFKDDIFEIAVRGWLLGVTFALGILISLSGVSWQIFGWYLTALSFFHWSEYVVTSITNPRNLSLSSYLLDHSTAYYVAAVTSWSEFLIESLFLPGMKQYYYVSALGVLLVCAGEVFRKLAMFHCGENFNHHIRHLRDDRHRLVTSGVYSLCRHPSYVGWFCWSVGTQVLLCNPLCIVGYTAASWMFFKERIEAEEVTLLNFFKDDYVRYQRQVPTGLPFIRGYDLEGGDLHDQ